MTTEIILNVYDLSPDQNAYLNPLGLGFYHTGIEIGGFEYQYGGNPDVSRSGVFQHAPLNVAGATYRESFLLGIVKDLRTAHAALDVVKEQFRANEYNLITRNCNHFSEALSLKLLNKRIPSFINRMARLGYGASCFLP